MYLDKLHKNGRENARYSRIYTSYLYLSLTTSCIDERPSLLISKSSKDDRTTTQVQELISDDKVDEIARMISGASVTDLTRENAREMIQHNQRRR